MIGLRTRYDAQLHEARGTLTQPSLRYWPLETTVNIYYREERNPATEIADGFDVDRKGLSILQERELTDRYVELRLSLRAGAHVQRRKYSIPIRRLPSRL